MHKLPSPNILGELPQAEDFEINQRISDFFLKQENTLFFSPKADLLISIPLYKQGATWAKAGGGARAPLTRFPLCSPLRCQWSSETSLKNSNTTKWGHTHSMPEPELGCPGRQPPATCGPKPLKGSQSKLSCVKTVNTHLISKSFMKKKHLS